MNRIKMTAIAAAMTFAFSTGATAASDEKAAAPVSKQESAGEYVNDAVITTKVKAAVLGESSLSSAEINVETYKGTVQLTGFVGIPRRYRQGSPGRQGVKGVTSVKNDMIVKGQK